MACPTIQRARTRPIKEAGWDGNWWQMADGRQANGRLSRSRGETRCGEDSCGGSVAGESEADACRGLDGWDG
jgi:hypothetical protein